MDTKSNESTTTIGREASLRGDLIATGDIVVEGAIDGSLQAAGSRVTIGRDARVRADVLAKEVIVAGRVLGEVRGTERVELRSTAAVEGNVFTQRFSMEADAVLRGRVDPTQPGAAVDVPAAETARGASPEPQGTMGLFGGTRPSGQMPAGLAAAARNFGASPSPTGLSALRGDSEDSDRADNEA